jgi:hypothetical protein
MLAHISGAGWDLCSLSPEIKESAGTRPGDWVVTTMDEAWAPVEIRYTEKEWERLSHMATHGLRNGTKAGALHGMLEQTAHTLWPSGSLEHISMRHLGPVGVLRYTSGHLVPAWFVPYLPARAAATFGRSWVVRTTLSRVVYGPAPDPMSMVGRFFQDMADEGCLTLWELGCEPASGVPGDTPTTTTHDGWITSLALEEYALMSMLPFSDRAASESASVAPAEATVPTEPSEPDPPVDNGGAPPSSSAPDPPVDNGGAAPPSGEPDPPDDKGGATPRDGDTSRQDPPEPPGDDGDTGSQEEPSEIAFPLGQPIHGGFTPEDAEVLARTTNGRTVMIGDAWAVIGQHRDADAPRDDAPIVGAVLAPIPVLPHVYANTAANAMAAKRERLDEKALKPDIDRKLKDKIGRVVRDSIRGKASVAWCSKERVQTWAESNFDLAALKSGKWSQQRFESAIGSLLAKAEPRMEHTLAVKAEPMPRGKPPRLLIADGDAGQLMGLAAVKCFEDLIFEHFESQSIKHCSKRDAIKRVLGHLKKPGSGVIEGDGSAWDTTCNQSIRDLIENPLLHHITQVLLEYGVVPPQWLTTYDDANWCKTIRGLFKKVKPMLVVVFDAIRRSGDRKTSCANYWVNRVMMACSLFDEPEVFLDPSRRKARAADGTMRWCFFAFEGDDSIVALKPPLKAGSKLADAFHDTWRRGGFRMNAVLCESRATFVGYHIACVNGEATDIACPELPRALRNAGISTSTAAVKAAKEGDTATLRRLASAACIARAAEFAGVIPSVSDKFLTYALACDETDFKDREMSFRASDSPDVGSHELVDRIRAQNGAVSPTEEDATLAALGYSVTPYEKAQFHSFIWDWESLGDVDGFAESIPPTWR